MFNYKKTRHWAENTQIIMQLGLTMIGCIGFCLAVGFYLDRWIGTRGVFITIFILLGVAGGANVCYRQIMDVTEPDNTSDTSGNGHD